MSRAARTPGTKGAALADLARTPLDPDAFAARVMVAVRREATPTPARTLVLALRARSAGDAASALWVAWHLGTVRAWRVAPSVRARSIALVLAVACALATGSLATAAAVRVAAQPVVQLFQAGIDERGQVDHNRSRADEQGPTQREQAGPNGHDTDDAVERPTRDTREDPDTAVDRAGSDQTSDDDVDAATDNGRDEADGGDESGTDEAADDPSGTSGADENDEAADRGSVTDDDPDEPARADGGTVAPDESESDDSGGDSSDGDDSGGGD